MTPIRPTALHRRTPRAMLALALALAPLAPAHAAELTFSRIGAGDAGLQQFWQLTPEEADQAVT